MCSEVKHSEFRASRRVWYTSCGRCSTREEAGAVDQPEGCDEGQTRPYCHGRHDPRREDTRGENGHLLIGARGHLGQQYHDAADSHCTQTIKVQAREMVKWTDTPSSMRDVLGFIECFDKMEIIRSPKTRTQSWFLNLERSNIKMTFGLRDPVRWDDVWLCGFQSS